MVLFVWRLFNEPAVHLHLLFVSLSCSCSVEAHVTDGPLSEPPSYVNVLTQSSFVQAP